MMDQGHVVQSESDESNTLTTVCLGTSSSSSYPDLSEEMMKGASGPAAAIRLCFAAVGPEVHQSTPSAHVIILG